MKTGPAAGSELAVGAARAIGGYAVLVDRCHPFAAAIDTDGAVCATTSWAHLVSPPNALHDPRRGGSAAQDLLDDAPSM